MALDCKRVQSENSELRDENDRLRMLKEQREEQAQRESEQRRREWREQARQEMCTAHDWPDAFRKSIILHRREASSEASDNRDIQKLLAEHPDQSDASAMQPITYFTDRIPQLEKAQAIYFEEIAAVEKQIEALRAQVLTKAAERVEAETDLADVADMLRQNDTNGMVDW